MKMRRLLKTFGRGLLGLVGIGLVVYLGFVVMARPVPLHPWFAPRPGDHQPLVFAHQGGENIRPSNTLLAFQHAVELGADVLDTDMHLTKDGVLVLMHDQTVDRTTDGTGAIRDLTLAKIKQLDAGYRFTIDDGQTFPYRGQGVRVPTLEEVFFAFPGKRFGIEIKQAEPVDTAKRFCALIRQYHLEAGVLVSSFRQANMDAFRMECPEVATSATEDEVRPFFFASLLGMTRAFTPIYQSLQVPEEAAGFQLLTPQFIAAARERGLAVQPWTINEADDLKHVLALGVDGINTDNPDRLLEMMK